MGILHSIARFVDWKTEDEEDGKIRPFHHPYPLHQKHYNHKSGSGHDSSRISSDERAFTILKFHSLDSLASTTASQDIVDSAVVAAVGVHSAEEKVIVKHEVVVHVDEGIKCIKHYSCHHRILLVGEGDFSFSACLSVAFGWASNIIATSLDSKAFLKENYKNAVYNIKELRSRGSKVMHGIDATKMSDHALLGHLKFDRIIFNFPFAGFFKELSRKSQLRLHRRLVSLFLKNAKEMLSENGEIHISHKTNHFHNEWNLVSMASSHGLELIEAVDFNKYEYPGYNTKRGFGGDNNFNCNPAKTYKFQLKTLSYYY